MIAAILLLYLLVHRSKEDSLRDFLYAMILWTTYLYAITEILSVFQAISWSSLLLSWGIADVLLLGILLGTRRHALMPNLRSGIGKKPSLQSTLPVVLFAMFAVGTLLLALAIVPYNWDSMTYHLPRIVYWAKHGSVAHYATNIDRQVASPVLASFVNLHIYVLTGATGSLPNLLQWGSFLICGLLVYGIATKLTLSRMSCLLSAILFYTMPIAFAEALSTLVDDYAALWCLAYVYLLLDLLHPEEQIHFDWETTVRVMALGACVAFGYLAKPSSLFAMLIFLAWLCIRMLRRKDSLRVVRYGALAGGVILILLAPELLRNLHTFGSISSSVAGARQLVGTWDPRYLLVSFLKNLTFNLPIALIPHCSDLIKWVVSGIAWHIGVNINAPSISEDGRYFEVPSPGQYECESAINPLIVWLTLIALLAALVMHRAFRERRCLRSYFLASIGSFFFFLTFLMWEPYISRYMIAYLALLCPCIGIVIDLLGKRVHRYVIRCVYGLLVLACVTELAGLTGYYTSLASRQADGLEGFFLYNTVIYEDYLAIAEMINDSEATSVGLLLGVDTYEYPLLCMMDDGVELRHVHVNNPTGIYEDDTFCPDLVVVYEAGDVTEVTVGGDRYEEVMELENGGVWERTVISVPTDAPDNADMLPSSGLHTSP